MRTAAPVISVALALAVMWTIIWQGVNMWRQPRGITMPSLSGPMIATPSPPLSEAPPAAPDEGAGSASRTADVAPAANAPALSTPLTEARSPAEPTAPAVDETALRYFARQGDTRRLNAEIARLRALYPGWTPPDDPLKAPPVADPQLDRLWRLFAQGEIAAARAAIATRQGAEPGWTPPKDLLDQLALADTRERLVNASDAKQYATVIQIAAATPALRTCGDVDALWRVAEAFARTDRQARAQDAYRYILSACTNGPERLATMQKAAALLPREAVDPLLSLSHSGPDGDEFQSVRESLARSAIAAGGADPKANASADDIALLQRLAEKEKSEADPALLGWYFLRRDDAKEAERWFRLSFDRQNGPQTAQGLALALTALKRPAEAEAALFRWAAASEEAGKVYAAAVANLLALQPPPALAPDVLARIVEATARRRDANLAQELGWYSHAYGQDETAARWFATGLAWKPDDEPSAYGLVIVDASLGRRDAVKALLRVWGERSARVQALGDPAVAKRLATRPLAQGVALAAPALPATPGAAPDLAAPAPDKAAPPRTRPAANEEARPNDRTAVGADSSALTRGWSLMQLDRPSEAVLAFQTALASGAAKQRQDAAYGLSLAYLRLGLTADANVASSQAPQSGERTGELRLAILTQRIRAAYEAARYDEALIGLDARARLAPEQTDLMSLRGWCYYHLSRYREATQVFQAVAATGSADAAIAFEAAKAPLTNGRGP
jgi:cellulose synthase operon protein C